jgi:serine protease inhibitor
MQNYSASVIFAFLVFSVVLIGLFYFQSNEKFEEVGSSAVDSMLSSTSDFTLPSFSGENKNGSFTLNDIADRSNKFAQSFFKAYNSNRAYSPISILAALSVLSESAGGSTKLQIGQSYNATFCYDDLISIMSQFGGTKKDPAYISTYVSVNNKVSLNQSFINFMKPIATISADDFSNNSLKTISTINDFFRDRTDGHLTNAAKSIKGESLALVFNTFYFKNQWATQFELRSSLPINFTTTSGAIRQFRAVHRIAPVAYSADEFYQLIELDFQNQDYSMGLFLPKLDKRNKIVPAKFNLHLLNTYISKLTTKEIVEIVVPKFRFKRMLRLSNVLRNSAKITDMFDSSKASFDLVAPEGGFYVTDIVHEGFIAFDEVGVNSMKNWWRDYKEENNIGGGKRINNKMKNNSTSTTPIVIRAAKQFFASRNFIFYIRYRPSNLLLFVGDFNG